MNGFEFVHQGNPLAFAASDFVKLVFEFGGKVVIDVLGEVFGQEFVDDVACVGGHEAFLLKGNVFAVFERGDDAGVGRGRPMPYSSRALTSVASL